MKKATLYCDGASLGNPGDSGAGAVVTLGGQTVEISEYIGKTTNNVAEYTALIRGLETARDIGAESVEVFLDSELIVRQMLGVYKVKSEHLQGLWLKARQLASGFRHFSISHIPRELNGRADKLSKKGAASSKTTPA